MIFLKKLYAEGFKSFAKPTTIDFEHQMTSIIGPNGSGKSNVVDAIKWTIGEQSIKQLRGTEKTNLIFMGSENLPESDFALVELTFDNSARLLHKDLDEIKISRKLIRKTGESIYLLNDEPAKLKEIQEIFLDTGLSKGSLGIISQGTVNWFSECKPDERRKIFEDASGIGRYTKKKTESLRQLEVCRANLDTVEVKVKSIQRELNKLNNQAQKLEEYKNKSEQLKELDLTIKAKDYYNAKNNLEEYSSIKIKASSNKEMIESNIECYKALIEEKNKLFEQTQVEIQQLENNSQQLREEYSRYERSLQTYKNNLDNNRFSNDPETRIKSYASLIKDSKTEIEASEKRKISLEEKIANRKIELESTQLELNALESQNFSLNNELLSKRKDLEFLVKEYENSTNNDRGLKAVLSNKTNFPGVVGPIFELIKVKSKYETAITTALGNAAKNVVTLNEKTAINVLNFLKESKSGYLTLLPLDKIQTKSIPEEILDGVKSMNGFIDVAANLVSIKDEYKNAIYNILGATLIVEDINSASIISEVLKQKYKIVTLDGDIKNPGGSISGGYKAKSNVTLNLAEKVERAKQEVEQLTIKQRQVSLEVEKLRSTLSELQSVQNSDTSNLNFVISRIQEYVKNLKDNEAEYEVLVKQYKNVNVDNSKTTEDELVEKVANLNIKLEEVIGECSLKKQTNNKLWQEIRSFSEEKDKYDIEFVKVMDQLRLSETEITKSQNKIQNIENEIIKNYKISLDILEFEYLQKELSMSEPEARRMIAILQSEIESMGPINYDVLNELETKQKEFDNISVEYEDSLNSYNKLQEIIAELDKKAITDFKTLIKKVNECIPSIFNELFGGGFCEIKLTEPENVLDSGIDVIVQPRGKKVKHLTLLSGGEKTMVALTVLFAILQSSKLPLIILDEAEAALDELNVEIFAKIIKKYSNKTQFIVITHRPGTMKESSALYGITMQDKGVSIVLKTSFKNINFKELN